MGRRPIRPVAGLVALALTGCAAPAAPADKGGYVWGEVDSTGCSYVRNWLGNLTDGTVRTSLHNGTKAMTSVLQKQETETWLNYKVLGVTRLRLQVTDVRSGYGPYVAVDSILLCTN